MDRPIPYDPFPGLGDDEYIRIKKKYFRQLVTMEMWFFERIEELTMQTRIELTDLMQELGYIQEQEVD